MDYVEALLAVAESLSDIRRRLITLEAKTDSDPRDQTGVSRLEETVHSLLLRVEILENEDALDRTIDRRVNAAIDNIDFEEKVRDVLVECITFETTVS